MGIKKLSWKEIVGIALSFIFVLSAIITIVKGWDVVLNCLRYLGNLILEIFKFSISTTGRDVLLFILIVGILIMVSRRLKKLQVAFEELKKPVPEREKKEDKEFEWTDEHELLLRFIVEDGGEIISEELLGIYLEKFPIDSRLDFDLCFDDLEEINLIQCTGEAGGSRLYVATKEGRRYLKKKIREKVKKKGKGIKPTREHFYVLGSIANAPTSIGQTALFEPYEKRFPNSIMVDLRSIINDLMKMGFIYQAGSKGEELLYKATDKGVILIRMKLEKVRNKEKSS